MVRIYHFWQLSVFRPIQAYLLQALRQVYFLNHDEMAYLTHMLDFLRTAEVKGLSTRDFKLYIGNGNLQKIRLLKIV